jgi:5'(3')-deoxyribonucleotidase
MLILCDIDGTAADINHRRHFVENGKKDWKSFFDEMVYDTPNAWCVELLKAMTYEGHEVIFISGRPDNYRDKTEQWLKEYYPFCSEQLILHMRPAGNSEPDYLIKENILAANFDDNNQKNILFVLDDRQQVVDMWRKNGLVVLQCDAGNF